MSEHVLELRNIRKAYNKGLPNEVNVLRGIDLNVKAGEIVALVAPSGAGKSTLLHVAGLLDHADSGEVVFAGNNVEHCGDAQRTSLRCEDVGFVYQFHHLLPEFSALENIVLPQLVAGESRKAAQARGYELLERVGLGARADHRPAELSGGEAQRVAFCRALANAPRILLGDEPTGNLDPQTADQLFEVLMDLVRSTGMSALIATHNMELAARMDRIMRLNGGHLSQDKA